MRDVSLLRERMPLAIAPAREGGYDVTFEPCGHTCRFYVLPYLTERYYCEECFSLFIATMKAERWMLNP